MSESFSIYIVDEEELPEEIDAVSDDEIYEQLVSAIETHGKLHQVIEMTEDDFIDALDALDTLMDGNRLLPNCAMNNSPHEILGKNSDCPYLGYFSPSQVQELLYLFESLSEDSLDTVESVETHSEVHEAFLSAVSTALDADYAIAVIHA